MSENVSSDPTIEHGAEMDYAQHESTYSTFLALTKWGIIFNIVLMIAMAIGFFGGGGLFGGILAFVVLGIVSWILF